MKNKMMIANLKMNLTAPEINSYLSKINGNIHSNKVIICPTNIYIPYFLGHDYGVGIQNINAEEQGSYTGEVSAKQAHSLGIEYVIIGHNERRVYFEETEKMIRKKVSTALINGMNVVLCIGETKEEKDTGTTYEIIKQELYQTLKGYTKRDIQRVIIAYEPIWAIGTGKVPSISEIQNTVSFIKETMESLFGTEEIPVLYGGSVNLDHIKELALTKNIDGFLVGEASTDPDIFLQMIEVAVTM